MKLQKRIWTRLLAALPLFMLIACVDQGKVDQGRVVKFDKEKRTVTIIRDKKIDTLNPDYSYLPPLTYNLPVDPAEMGPEPKAAGRMKLDTKAKQVTLYDPQQQNFRVIDVQITDLMENIDKNNPLVYDQAEKKAKKFPVIDKAKKTVTIYSGRQKMLCTVQVPEEFIALPEASWDAGDECRIYYKEEGKALRFMNISKTDIFKK
jgi:hypothetical protein